MVCSDGKAVIVTLGNELRGDDGAGIFFGSLIRDHTPFEVFDGGDAPENITGLIVKKHPDTIIIVDAMDFGGKPGDIKTVSVEKLEKDCVSTHGSLKLFADYIGKMTGARILIIGFQPKDTGLGKGISPEVAESVRKMADEFMKSENFLHTLQNPGGDLIGENK